MTAVAERQTLTVRCSVHFTAAAKGRKRMARGKVPEMPPALAGRVPRVARLTALAIRFDELLRQGGVRDYAELARLGHVTRARVTQIMNLLNLAPDLQEALLFLPPTVAGRDEIKEWQVRPIAAEVNWLIQRQLWRNVANSAFVSIKA